eukprot:gnl/MRDRNA2_/MRDRNA2_163697_c0_seq1.p1 gnl/MRDRNA2_/MRDRNA2_163697_c0~~gnl/MRDRNA2_/MRDRNA2_163697_c0_seq1.p1  ORF type:complete len:539 (+),score=70.24 gnl/MRDRNA2_/MRDRNA2_163697_c0_seq1:143-1618(+)
MSYNPPLFKYVPHISTGNSVLHWAPQVTIIFFHILVMLLLFKLIMSVIMEGYKNSSRSKKNYPYSVREEICIIGRYFYDYLWRHRICRAPYVSFEQLVISLALIREAGKRDVKKPWRSRYVGFIQGPEAIQEALNNVYTGNLPEGVDPAKRPKIKAIGKHFKFRGCSLRDAQWVFQRYGFPKSIAMHDLAEHVMEVEERRELERLENERKEKEPTKEEEIHQLARAKAQGVVEEITQKLNDAFELHRKRRQSRRASIPEDHEGNDHDEEQEQAPSSTPPVLTLQYRLDESLVKSVFEQYDFYGIGHIDIRFMGHALGPPPGLGFEVPKPILKQLLQKYDCDHDGAYDYKEFKNLVTDPMLQGRYVGDRKSLSMKAVANSQETLQRRLTPIFRKNVRKVQMMRTISKQIKPKIKLSRFQTMKSLFHSAKDKVCCLESILNCCSCFCPPGSRHPWHTFQSVNQPPPGQMQTEPLLHSKEYSPESQTSSKIHFV